MDGIGRTATASIGVAHATIAGDRLDAGVGAQPGCEAVRLSVGQQVNDDMTFEVHENRAVTLAAAPALRWLSTGYAVGTLASFAPSSTPSTRGAVAGVAGAPRRTKAEQGRTAHGRADPLGQARTGLAAQRQADGVLQAAQARCPLGHTARQRRASAQRRCGARSRAARSAAGAPAARPARDGLATANPPVGGDSCCAAAMTDGRNRDKPERRCKSGT